MSQKILLKNEFSYVSVELDDSANGIRLIIKDMRSGKKIYLDPLELESLAWSSHHDFFQLLNPSHARWKEKKGSM